MEDVYIVRVRAVTQSGEKTDWTGKTLSLKHGKQYTVGNVLFTQMDTYGLRYKIK